MCRLLDQSGSAQQKFQGHEGVRDHDREEQADDSGPTTDNDGHHGSDDQTQLQTRSCRASIYLVLAHSVSAICNCQISGYYSR